jgi:hypothetical protein
MAFQQNGFNGGGFQQQQSFGQQNNFQQQRTNFNQRNFQGGGNQQQQRGPIGLSQIVLTGYLTKESESKMVGQSKVAVNTLAVNHADGSTDFWTIEVWAGSGQNSGKHDFFMNSCHKGRHITVSGTAILNRRRRQNNGQDVADQNGHAVYDTYPTVRAQLIDGGPFQQDNKNAGGNSQPQQQARGGYNAPQTQPPYQQMPQQAPQGNFGAPQQGNFGAPFGAPQQAVGGGFR